MTDCFKRIGSAMHLFMQPQLYTVSGIVLRYDAI